jgi:hypothetical protein
MRLLCTRPASGRKTGHSLCRTSRQIGPKAAPSLPRVSLCTRPAAGKSGRQARARRRAEQTDRQTDTHASAHKMARQIDSQAAPRGPTRMEHERWHTKARCLTECPKETDAWAALARAACSNTDAVHMRWPAQDPRGFGIQNRTFGPYLAANNRIIIPLMGSWAMGSGRTPR